MASEWSSTVALGKAALCKVSARELTANPASRLATHTDVAALRSFVIFRLLWVSRGGSSAERH
jgi:hypothetical protein